MHKIIFISLLLFTLGNHTVFSQTGTEAVLVAKDTLKSNDIDPLTPAKAAFFSAILPGLGQAYNKKYWKIPLVYGAIGTSLYFYIDSNKKYHQYRDAYKSRLEGYTTDDLAFLDNNRLIAGQKFYQRNRDLSALITIAFYALNILDANVDAALLQFNVDENLSVRPVLYPDNVTFKTNVGLTFNYQF
ncbi:hypothetical protein EKM05_10420 [Flavobacterium sp. GSP27]|uniref:DUF5683 domain-containing protein n=1 Tax=Flavobacterium bomense TaxID=2497483 RepID=A0A3S0UYL4_9FLAO|nr:MULTISPECIES: DUF5683 domain-containing protein [Flavobacterium]RTY91706.1 hypothetical protein EKL32_18570 [Flavobacterium sp. GSN2]RTY69012.1 hypothetical protein EKL95_07415 [Flavobacterium sp. LB2P53]RTY74315.1 hypothetical protein EKL96_09665 [Flavobacterium sp. LS1R10]RTY80831.1 hypothetical protein EKL97_10045 [Flavobacterium sp. LS1P28]RTY83789.1 hypothetical protein EKL99_04210 [Flavobacterium sp. ZB4P23]